ncbi:hypothetical protein [Natrinema versiforme]|uniref:Uncharacterized protein n=1 Tax=Natrinema versiforme JCM 10478 TaxID=1227496 RepID=L9XTB1_9EURY|nr:hypothetical protein [Natrinema versiforme]ELY65014.1 hypothetical protein C489_16406 [Natrinema versiforme JCM 10478]
MRRSIVITAVLLVLAFVLVGGPSLLLSLSTEQVASEQPAQTEPAPDLVSFEDSESGFWEYLSPTRGFQKRSPVNVVVRGDLADVERVLTDADDGDWSEINESEEEALPETYSLTGGNESDNETQPANATADGDQPAPASEPEPENETVANDSAANDSAENATDEEEEEVDEPRGSLPNLDWGQADGGTRYAYVDPGPNESGYWITESRQLEDGDYYGQRYHIRLYESPNEGDDWVAMQTHSEHFDWFTLRHRVHGSQDAQTKVENDFMDHPRVDVQEDVTRIYLDNRNSADADGWATLVELAGLFVVPTLVGVGAGKRRLDASSGTEQPVDRVAQRAPNAIDDHLTDVDRRRLAAAYARLEAGHVLLVFTILALYLGVRMGGLVLERQAGFLTPHQIAALLYPVIGVGIPAATYLIARGLTRRLDAAVVAAGSLALAVWLDYGLLGVSSLPVDVVAQRMLVVVALGLIAGGAAKRAARDSKFNDMLLVGTVMWLLVLAGTLFGYL